MMMPKVTIAERHPACVRDLLTFMDGPELRHLPWYSRFRAVIDLFFYTICRDEQNYIKTVEELKRPAVLKLPELFAEFLLEMSFNPSDLLGKVYQAWSVGDRKNLAQYFTPDAVTACMAEMIIHDTRREQYTKPEGLSIAEPAAGAGGMLIQAVRIINREHGVWGTSRTALWANDLDIVCSRMTAVQLAWLSGFSPIGRVEVFQGDTLGPPPELTKIIGWDFPKQPRTGRKVKRMGGAHA
jgi:hypothetical protein